VAFEVEAWFVDGDRTSAAQIQSLADGSPDNAFFVVRDGSTIEGCVLAERIDATRGYIGLLAVSPSKQGAGIGNQLLTHAEGYLRTLGCQTVQITVVDLRTELFPYYEARGYRRTGEVAPFPREAKTPCELVAMAKPL
jgi:predicted N-acetyltransferase YhbS